MPILLGASNNVAKGKQKEMNRNLLEMKDKYNEIYRFMLDILKLKEKEALQNTLKLEGAISENVLKRFKNFIKYTNKKMLTNEEYLNEFNKFFNKELNNEKTT